jgi:hypothetical protein
VAVQITLALQKPYALLQPSVVVCTDLCLFSQTCEHSIFFSEGP